MTELIPLNILTRPSWSTKFPSWTWIGERGRESPQTALLLSKLKISRDLLLIVNLACLLTILSLKPYSIMLLGRVHRSHYNYVFVLYKYLLFKIIFGIYHLKLPENTIFIFISVFESWYWNPVSVSLCFVCYQPVSITLQTVCPCRTQCIRLGM